METKGDRWIFDIDNHSLSSSELSTLRRTRLAQWLINAPPHGRLASAKANQCTFPCQSFEPCKNGSIQQPKTQQVIMHCSFHSIQLHFTLTFDKAQKSTNNHSTHRQTLLPIIVLPFHLQTTTWIDKVFYITNTWQMAAPVGHEIWPVKRFTEATMIDKPRPQKTTVVWYSYRSLLGENRPRQTVHQSKYGYMVSAQKGFQASTYYDNLCMFRNILWHTKFIHSNQCFAFSFELTDQSKLCEVKTSRQSSLEMLGNQDNRYPRAPTQTLSDCRLYLYCTSAPRSHNSTFYKSEILNTDNSVIPVGCII